MYQISDKFLVWSEVVNTTLPNKGELPIPVVINTYISLDDTPIKGNCSAIDPKTDLATERWISNQLSQNNIWAWCTVQVQATHSGLFGNDFLGCCSYRSCDDFRSGGYYQDMINTAIENLQSAFETTKGT